MKRILLIIAYDGTEYCGWQIQPNGVTIEAVLNRELTRLLGEEIKVIGASRTDAGVHAMGNVCVFDTDTRIPPEKISYALNQSLPEDIVVQQSKEVPLDFHPGDEHWGLGVRVVSGEGYERLPVGTFGWSGAYGTHCWIDPVNRVTAVYMKNSRHDGGSGAQTSANFERDVFNSFE